MSETRNEHTNKIAMGILENEYGDYPRNWWHYDSEYKMLIEAQTQAWKQANEAAEQHGQALPMCGVMPLSLTAENGAKGLLIGEFHETIVCHDDEGEPYEVKMPVEWDTIKSIYAKIVEHYGAFLK